MNNSERLWADIERAIVRKLKTSAFEKTPHKFLPEGELNRILHDFSRREQYGCQGNLRNLITVLLGLRASPAADKTQALVHYILDKKPPALKLFFTVLRAKHQQPYEVMVRFMHKPINDADLPLQWSTEEDFRDHLALSETEVDELWTISHIDDFQLTQRIFLAPVLTTDPKGMPGQFGQNTLPFVEGHTVSKRGGFGVVSRYTIQTENLHVIEKIRPSCIVAVKELTKDNDDVARHWIREVDALSRMNTLNKEHIVRFITAFTRGKPGDRQNNLDHYVVFEWAHGGNLKDLWTQFPGPQRDPAVTKWIMEQFYGLSQALGAAHYLLDNKGEYIGESYRHGDLKPENILWFPSGKGLSGTLKICDFGEAKNHGDITKLRHGTTAKFGTRRYEPPEIIDEPIPSQGEPLARSRLYDLWSIGCVMLECIIWLVYGLDEHKRFNKDNRGDHGVSDNFYETPKKGSTVRTVVHGAVNRWITHMTNESFCRPGETAIGDALEIVSKGLLVVQLPKGDLDNARVALFRRTHPMIAAPTSRVSTTSVSVPTGMSPEDDHFPKRAIADHTKRGRLMTNTHTTEVSSPGNKPAIQVIPAEGPKTSIREDISSGEPQRYRATDLADRLGELVTGRHDNAYWMAPGSPTKVPLPRGSHGDFLSPDSAGVPGERGAGNKKDQGDYTHPKLDIERWTFEVDNDFAKGLHNLALPTAKPPTEKLCGSCAEIQEGLWSPFLRVSLAKHKLKENAEFELCELCSLLWPACKAIERKEVNFGLVASNLMISEETTPVISLFRKNESSKANHLQIGFPELPEPGKRAHLNTIRAWIADCDENHTYPFCKPRGRPNVRTQEVIRKPTRLIDVQSGDDDFVKVTLTRDDDHEQWVALSYRWEDTHHFSSTKANIGDHMQGMKVAKLPHVFQDAIWMTRGLGIRYLWIDAVCIIQGNDGDFATESKRMEDVYSGAYCVLAASYTNSYRLFHPRKSRSYVALGSHDSQTGIVYACEMIDDFKGHVLDGPLSRRGWVLQEHALARRTIFFTEYQTYWECGHGVRCETMTKMKNLSAALLGDPDFPHLLEPARHGERILRYQELYQQYSRLKLTSNYDRPAAINGLERRLLRAMKVTGGFGVFEDPNNSGLLRRSLMWRRATETLRAIDFPEGREKVPSWSWMSVSGPIDYVRLEFGNFDWTKIHSPWSNMQLSWQTDNVIVAQARYLSAQERPISSEIGIELDNPGEDNQGRLLAITLGIEKGNKNAQDKQHCVLVVEALSSLEAYGIQCRRVGAGIVTGKHLLGGESTCFII